MSKTNPTRTIAAARGEIVHPDGVINLNAGSCSPVPQPVLNAQLAHLTMQSRDPVEYIWTASIPHIENGRRALASFLGTDSDNLLLCTNASWAVNTVLQTFAWKSGDELLITDQEYHHYRPLFALLTKKFQVAVKTVALPLATESDTWDSTAVCALFRQALTSNTRMLFFSHITSPTGSRLPAAELCALAREREVLSFVDGAHGPGHIPVDLDQMRPHFYTANVHKWLMNPAGCAFLYADPEVRFAFSPLMCMSGYDAVARRENRVTAAGCTAWQYAHEYQGTRNLTPLTVLADTVAFFTSIGVGEVVSAWQENTRHLRSLLRTTGLPIVTADAAAKGADPQTCLTACQLPLPRIDPNKARSWFRREHGIELAFPVLADGRVLLRVSSAWFNTKEQLERLVPLLNGCDWGRFV
jgi:isopenicillin-N epimerase